MDPIESYIIRNIAIGETAVNQLSGISECVNQSSRWPIHGRIMQGGSVEPSDATHSITVIRLREKLAPIYPLSSGN